MPDAKKGTFGGKIQDPAIERELYLTLEELYLGCDKKMKISRHVMNEVRELQSNYRLNSLRMDTHHLYATKFFQSESSAAGKLEPESLSKKKEIKDQILFLLIWVRYFFSVSLVSIFQFTF